MPSIAYFYPVRACAFFVMVFTQMLEVCTDVVHLLHAAESSVFSQTDAAPASRCSFSLYVLGVDCDLYAEGLFHVLVDSLLLCACSTIYSTPHLLPWHSKPIGSDLLYVGLAISSCNRWWSLNPVGLQPPSRLGYRYHPLRLLRVLGGVRGPC